MVVLRSPIRGGGGNGSSDDRLTAEPDSTTQRSTVGFGRTTTPGLAGPGLADSGSGFGGGSLSTGGQSSSATGGIGSNLGTGELNMADRTLFRASGSNLGTGELNMADRTLFRASDSGLNRQDRTLFRAENAEQSSGGTDFDVEVGQPAPIQTIDTTGGGPGRETQSSGIGGGDGILGSIADTAGDLFGGTQQAAEGLVGTTVETVQAPVDIVRGRESVADASSDIGREVVSIAADDPDAWRRSFRERQAERGFDLDEDRAAIQEGFDGGVLDQLGATNRVLKVGTDAVFDAPGGSVQRTTRDALQTVTGDNSDQDLANTLRGGYQTFIDSTDGAIETLTPGDRSETALKTGRDWFLALPAKGITSGFTGIDPEDAEVGARTEPLDFYGVIGLDAAPAARGVAKLARGASRADEAAEAATAASRGTAAADDAAETPTQSGMSGAIRGIGRVLRGTGNRVGGAASGLGGVFRRGGDDIPTSASSLRPRTTRPAQSEVQTASFSQIDELDRSVGTQSEFANLGEDFTSADEVFEGADELDQSVGTDSGFENLRDDFTLDSLFDDDADTLASGGRPLDEADTTGIQADEFGAAPDTVGDLQRGGDDALPVLSDETTSIGSIDSSLGDIPSLSSGGGVRGSVAGAVGGVTRRADEAFDSVVGRIGARGADEADEFATTSRSLDDTTGIRAADEAGQAPDSVDGLRLGRAGENLPTPRSGTDSLFRRIGSGIANNRLFQATAASVGSLAALDALDIDPLGGGPLFGPPGDLDGGGGEDQLTEGDTFRPRPVKTYTRNGEKLALLLIIEEATGEDSWEQAGYAILMGRSDGQPMVLSQSARIIPANPLYQDSEGIVPRPRFSIREQADDTFEAWWRDQSNRQDDQDQEDTGPGDADPDDSDVLNGSVDLPSTVQNGQDIQVPYEVELNNGPQQGLSSRTAVALETEDGLLPLAEDSISIPDSSGTDGGTFEVAGGWSLEPADYDAHGVVEDQGDWFTFWEGSVTVEPAEGNDSNGERDGDDWGEAELVQELPGGWYLFVQERVNGDETRFMVAGKNQNNERIYIHPDGRVEKEMHPFPTAEKAAQAHAAWVERVENGQAGPNETPDPGAGRPSGGGVTRDSRQSTRTSRGPAGVLDQAARMARQNPLLTGVAVFAVAGFGYYGYKQGWFDDQITWVKTSLGRVNPT